MSEPISRYFESSRLRLHYVVWGDETRSPLVLVHGGRDHARNWDNVAAAFVDRYAVYAIDLRGHGDSDWAIGSQYNFSDYVADLAKLIDVLGRDKVTLVGHSMGGTVVLQYAGAFPEKVEKVVAIEGMGQRGSRPRPAPQRLREFVAGVRELEQREPHHYDSIEEAAQRMREANRRLSPELALHLSRHAARQTEDGSYVWKFDNFMRSRGPYEWTAADGHSMFQAITAPVLLVRGGDGRGQDPEIDGTAAAFQDMRSVMVPDAGHWVHHDQLEAFLAAVGGFLAEDPAATHDAHAERLTDP